MPGDSHQRGEILGGQAAALPAIEDGEPLLRGKRGELHELRARQAAPARPGGKSTEGPR